MLSRSRQIWWKTIASLALAGGIALAQSPASTTDPSKLILVKAKSKPNNPWKEYKTRTLQAIPNFTPGAKHVPLCKYGGRADRQLPATGFFHAKQIDGRWWLIDPDGHPFIHVAVVTVTPGSSSAIKAAFKDKFATPETWAQRTNALLADHGFNGTGAWSAAATLRAASHPPAYTLLWNFMSAFGKSKKLTYTKPGHAGYPNDCIPVFHPDFAPFCDQLARQLAPTKDDPHLLGHFSDNEMPMARLDKFLALDPNDPNMGFGQKAAYQWLAQRKGKAQVTAADITDQDRDDFAGFVWDRYFQITTAAIRKHDPNHLCLGSRFHSAEKKSPASFAAAGKYLDVIAVNLYGAWTPDLEQLQSWGKWSGKPCLITEWYTKAEDSGFANTTGAGWIVPTQKDRGLFYQNFTLALLESRTCVGWHWFKYQDNDPADLKAEPSNRDSNKGIVTVKYDEYRPLLETMKALNQQVYPLIDRFDGK